MEECLEELEAVLGECARLGDCTNLPQLDKVLLSLKYARAHLGNYLNQISDDDVSELHSHLGLLCLEYETKLHTSFIVFEPFSNS